LLLETENGRMIEGLRFGIASAQDFARMSGLELLRAMMRQELPAPPISQALRMLLVEADEGRAVFEGYPDASLLNPLGIVHGGVALTLIDSAAGCAVHTLLGPGVGYTSVETKVNFTRPIKADTGTLRCEGKVITRGRQIATAEATLTDGMGKIVAHGTSTLMIFAPRRAD
jgi:uncharacterized protein (TIGR00369 family)